MCVCVSLSLHYNCMRANSAHWPRLNVCFIFITVTLSTWLFLQKSQISRNQDTRGYHRGWARDNIRNMAQELWANTHNKRWSKQNKLTNHDKLPVTKNIIKVIIINMGCAVLGRQQTLCARGTLPCRTTQVECLGN